MGRRYVNVRTASGYTPLHFAVAVDNVPCVRMLVTYGAGIHCSNVYRYELGHHARLLS